MWRKQSSLERHFQLSMSYRFHVLAKNKRWREYASTVKSTMARRLQQCLASIV
jgi:hypothetical protein